MRYLIQSIIFVFIAILLSACTPKVMIKKAYAPQILNKNTKDIAIEYISNDSVDLAKILQQKLNNTYVDGIKYYNVYNNTYQAKSILNGQIDYNRVAQEHYDKKQTNRDYCFQFKGEKYQRRYPVLINHRIKHPICLKYDTDLIPCIKKHHDLQASLKLIDKQNSSIILLKTYSASSTTQHCANDKNYSSDESQNKILANKIANQFISDITPSYGYYKIDIIEALDISLNQSQKTSFTQAIKAIENSNLSYAKTILETLDSQLNHTSSTILYNLALVNESLGNIYSANKLYSLAAKSINNKQIKVDLIYQGLNRTNEQISTTQAISPLMAH